MNRNMKAITWAMEVRGLEPGPWRVLMVLCGHVGKRDYEVWPSFRTIAEKAEISRDSAKRYVAVLVGRGFIQMVGAMMRDNGGRSSNRYRIQVDQIDVGPADDEEEDDYVPQPDPRCNLHRGQVQGSAPGARGTAAPSREPLKEGTSQLEDSPLPTEGAPVEGELFGNLPSTAVSTEIDIASWVESEWHNLKAEHPGIADVRKVDEGQAHTIRLRAKQHAKDGEGARDVWAVVFAEIRKSRFLCGRVPPRQGQDRPFKLTLNWLCSASKFRDVINGKFSSDTEQRFAYAPDGRALGPGDQTAARAIERQIARRKQQRGG